MVKKDVEQGVKSEFSIHHDGLLRFKNRVCIPSNTELKSEIIKEAHNSEFHNTPGQHKDVPGFERPLLVERNEARHR